MANYKFSEGAKEDLIRKHHFGVQKFGMNQADKYFNTFFEYFNKISENPFSFKTVDHIRSGYRQCPFDSDSIHFRLKENKVEIMAIIGMQDKDNKL